MMDLVSLSLWISTLSFYFTLCLAWCSVVARQLTLPQCTRKQNSSGSIRPPRVMSNRSNQWTFASPFWISRSLAEPQTNNSCRMHRSTWNENLHGDWQSRRKSFCEAIEYTRGNKKRVIFFLYIVWHEVRENLNFFTWIEATSLRPIRRMSSDFFNKTFNVCQPR